MNEPKKPIFEYSKDIDKKLPDAIKSILGMKIIQLEKIEQGAMNYVFKAETEGRPLLVRVFGKKDVVDLDKLLWIDQQLEKQGIHRSKILGYSTTDEFFPYGFMISEYILGKDGIAAISEGDISLEDYFVKLGTLVKKIHTIPVDAYGEINAKNHDGQHYSEYIMPKVKALLAECLETESLSKEQSEKIHQKIEQTLSKFEDRFNPVLVHGDGGPSNQILSEEHQLFMIDWDYARKGVWIEDLVPIILNAEKLSKDNTKNAVTTTARKSFLEGYGPTAFSEEEITELENVFVLIALLHNLSFYSADNRNEDAAIDARNKINELIIS